VTALAAATVAVAQTPQTPAEPPASATSQEQSPNSTAPPSDSRASPSSQSNSADKQALMKSCLTQVQAANPGVSEKDIKQFCDREVYRTPPQG